MARQDSFTYGAQSIGIVATSSTEIRDHYMFTTGEDDGEFVAQFVVRATDATDLATKCAAIEANLRMRYQRLEADFGSSVQVLADPSVTGNALQPAPPTTAVVVVLGGAGVVTAGAHEFWVTFVTAAGESVPGPMVALGTFDGAHAASVSAIPLGAAGTTARRVYMSKAGATIPYLALTISDNVTTTGTVNVADGSLTTAAPTTATGMGFDQEPHLEKIRDYPHSALARGYEFRVRYGLPPNYTDAYGPAAGRRQVDAALHYDVTNRQVVTMTGVWTQVPSLLARQQFLAVFDATSGYAAYRLGLINAAETTGATWTLSRKEELDPNSFATLTFTREYSQHVNGRRISTTEIFYQESGLRLVTVRGTYLRTVAPLSAAAAATANYEDVTNGGQSFAVATLGALTAAEGGPLTVGQDTELLTPKITPNEQDDRLDYALVYRELNFKQSSAAGSFLDDQNIVGDRVTFVSIFNETSDSPEPSPAAATPGPGGSSGGSRGGGGSFGIGALGAGGSGGFDFSTPGAGQDVTLGAPVKGAGFGLPGTVPAAGAAGGSSTPAQKPIDLLIQYEATLKKSVTNLNAYWKTNLQGYLIAAFQAQLGFQAVELVTAEVRPEPTSNRLAATVHARAYSGSVVAFQFRFGIAYDLGVRVDPAFTGNPHDYYVQQALPRLTMSRHVEVVYLAAGSFAISKYATPAALTGWVKLSESQPNIATRVFGVPAQGVAQTALSYATLDEDLIWVANNVATPATNKTITTSGTTPAGPTSFDLGVILASATTGT